MPLIIINAATGEHITQQHVTTANMRDICRPYLTDPAHLGERLQVIREETGKIIFDVTSIKYSTGRVRMTVYEEKTGLKPEKAAEKKVKMRTSSDVEQKRNSKKQISVTLEDARRNLTTSADFFHDKFQEIFSMAFEGSPYESLFYPDRETRDALLQWNDAPSRKDISELIDVYSFMEGTIGNFETAEIILLGNNPGANGATDPLERRKKGITETLRILHDYPEAFMRNNQGDTEDFYPLRNKAISEILPWFHNLLYGSKDCPALLSEMPAGNYARYFATAECFPFHSGNFAQSSKMIKEVKRELLITTLEKVKKACDNKKILIAINGYRNWIPIMKRELNFDLAAYEKFYIHKNTKGYLNERNLAHCADHLNHTHNHNAVAEIIQYMKTHCTLM